MFKKELMTGLKKKKKPVQLLYIVFNFLMGVQYFCHGIKTNTV